MSTTPPDDILNKFRYFKHNNTIYNNNVFSLKILFKTEIFSCYCCPVDF